MMSTPRFGRLLTAMVTPFDEDLALDFTRAQELSARIISQGSEGLIVSGTTGESPTISRSGRMDLFKAVISSVGDTASIIANIGDNCTEDSVAFAKEVAALDVDGIMAVVPYYNKPPQEGMYRHFRAIADAVDVPVILYNIPGRCVVDMSSDTVLRLAHDCQNIVGIKEANGNLENTERTLAEAPEGFEVFSGDDAWTLPLMSIGGTGVISTIGNIASDHMRPMIDAFVAGDRAAAEKIHNRLLPLMEGLFATSNPILVKEALKLMGFSVGGVRLPLVDATVLESLELAKTMHKSGVI